MRLSHLLTSAALLLPVAVLASETVTYTYDAKGRLTGTSRSGSVNNGVTKSHAFDRADNRSSYTVSAASNPAGFGTVADASFETPSTGGSYAYRPTATGATFSGNAGLTANGGPFGFTAPDGMQVAFLQTASSSPAVVTLAVTGLTTGANYVVRFKRQARPGGGGNAIAVSFGGTALGTYGGTSTFDLATTSAFQASSTSGTLTFAGEADASTDRTTGIDAVEVVPATTGGTEAVADSSFEQPSTGGSYVYRPTATGATFTGNAGLTANGGPFGFTARVTTYDAVNRPTASTSAYGTAVATTEQASFTANGQVATVTDGENNRTAYTYDGYDRLSRTLYPVTTKGAAASSTTDYEELGYDAAGNVITRRLRDGYSIAFGYDALDRLTSRALPGTLLSPSGGGSWTQTYGYDLTGHLVSATDPNNAYQNFGWDALGRKVSESSLYGGARTMLYDLAGRRTRLTWSDGFYVTYAYDVTGNPVSMAENGSTNLATFAYDALGRRTGAGLGNGASLSYAYDVVGRLNTLGHDLLGTSADLSVGFTYNAAGQIATRVSSNDSYGYAGYASGTSSYTADGLNRYTAAAGVTPAYDARGNTTSAGGATYGYNALNQLSTYPGGYIYHDALGHRLDVSTEAQAAVYDGDRVIAEVAYGGAVNRRYVYAPGEDTPLVWYEGAGTTGRRWLHADERGSVVAVSDGTGAALAINRYDEHGQPAAGNLGRFGYTGQQWIGAVGLWDYKARMYAPSLGRFLQTDPIGYGDGLNLYGYVGGDPVNRVDPTGLDVCDADVCSTEITVTAKRLNVAMPSVNFTPLAFAYRTSVSFAATAAGGGGGGGVGETPQNDQTGPDVIVSGVRCNATCQANLREQEREKWPILNGQYVLNPYYRDPAPWLTLPNVVAGSVVVAGAAATAPMAVAVEGADAGYAYGAGGRLAQIRFFTNRLIIRLDMATARTPTHINVQGNLFGSRFNFHIPP